MATPELEQDLEQLLRRCVECGLCLPHCATWLATGDEVQSPRGRLVLLGASLAGKHDASFLEAFDACIGCRACEAACPGGVPFTLLEMGQTLAAGRVNDRAAVPGFVLRRLDRRGWLTAVRRLSTVAVSTLRLVLGSHWRRRLARWSPARLLASTPRAPLGDGALVRQLDALCGRSGGWRCPDAVPGTGDPVVFFGGCANEGLLPGTARRARQLLEWSGHDIIEAPGQDCCGALASHSGRPGRAADLHRRNRQALAATPTMAVVTEAAGCGLELREYDDHMASRVQDLTVRLAATSLPVGAEIPLRVAIHDPCHLRHGQGVWQEARILLGRIPGLEVLEPQEAEVCCGSGGAWGLRYPEMSEELGRRKGRLLAATGADLVVSSNPGCLGQIADGLALEAPDLAILPLSDLLWYASLQRRPD